MRADANVLLPPRRVAFVLATLLLACLASSGEAAVPPAQQACLAAFGKAVRDVAKTQGKVVTRCLKEFVAGALVTSTPEVCLVSDPSGRLARAVNRAAAKVAAVCSGAPPTFGVSPFGSAAAGAGVVEVGYVQSIGDDLDTALVPDRLEASCQSQVAAAVLKCADARQRTFLIPATS